PVANEWGTAAEPGSTAGTSLQERSARCSAAPARATQPNAAMPSSGAPTRQTRSNWAARHVAILSVRRRNGLASSPSRHARRLARFLMPLMPLVPFLSGHIAAAIDDTAGFPSPGAPRGFPPPGHPAGLVPPSAPALLPRPPVSDAFSGRVPVGGRGSPAAGGPGLGRPPPLR